MLPALLPIVTFTWLLNENPIEISVPTFGAVQNHGVLASKGLLLARGHRPA